VRELPSFPTRRSSDLYVMAHGAYRESRVMRADRLVALPDGIADTAIAGAFLKGLTAQYLVTASYVVRPGDTVLVHAAAGGVGLRSEEHTSELQSRDNL